MPEQAHTAATDWELGPGCHVWAPGVDPEFSRSQAIRPMTATCGGRNSRPKSQSGGIALCLIRGSSFKAQQQREQTSRDHAGRLSSQDVAVYFG